MRKGFSVCAKAFKCQVFFSRKLPRPTTCKRRVATFSRLETLAEYSRTSPDRRGNSVSAGGGTFFELAAKVAFTTAGVTRFFTGGASRKTGGAAPTTSGGGVCAPARTQ